MSKSYEEFMDSKLSIKEFKKELKKLVNRTDFDSELVVIKITPVNIEIKRYCSERF